MTIAIINREQLMNQFENYLRSYTSENTIKNYIKSVSRFLDMLEVNNIGYTEFKTSDIQSFINLNNSSNSTQNTYLCAIRAFAKMLDIEVGKVLKIRKETKPTSMVSESDWKEISTLIMQGKEWERNLLLVSFGYTMGLRASEILNLSVSDIDLKKGFLIIKKSKRNKTRKVYLSAEIEKLLPVYISNNILSKSDMLFDITYSALEKMFGSICNKLEMDYTFHSLRHSKATMLLKKFDPKSVSEYLGNTVEVLLSTYAHVDEERLMEMR